MKNINLDANFHLTTLEKEIKMKIKSKIYKSVLIISLLLIAYFPASIIYSTYSVALANIEQFKNIFIAYSAVTSLVILQIIYIFKCMQLAMKITKHA